MASFEKDLPDLRGFLVKELTNEEVEELMKIIEEVNAEVTEVFEDDERFDSWIKIAEAGRKQGLHVIT